MEEITQDKQYAEMYKNAQQQQVMQRVANATTPETPVDVAHLLLLNSNTTSHLLEIDKELKLGNLNVIEKFQIYKFAMLFQDIMWLRREQTKKGLEYNARYSEIIDKYPELYEDENVVDRIEEDMDSEDETSKMFDKAGLLRMGLFIPALSRGTGGFERTKQVETISRATIETSDSTEKKPGFLGSFFGKGGRK